MKKVFSISFAILILLAGMHLTIATHICGGKVAAVKWSFSGAKASCSMEAEQQTCPSQKSIASNCCHNEIAVYAVDSNYIPFSFQIKELTQNLLQVFGLPVGYSVHSLTASNSLFENFIPPDNILASSVSLDDICVSRI